MRVIRKVLEMLTELDTSSEQIEMEGAILMESELVAWLKKSLA